MKADGRKIAVAFLLATSVPAGCYRPRLVDCIQACDQNQGCADGMTCSAGLCTRGPTCVAQVSAGSRHSCAIRGATVTCWGNNVHGQLGVPGTDNKGDDETQLPTVDLGTGHVATAIAAGGRHTCAILDGGAAGALACWGDNSFGQLNVTLGSGHTLTAIAAGLYHSCVVDSGAVRCWGDNRFGQLGPVDQSSSGPVPAVDLGGARALDVSAGAYHTCALLDGGAVACWGWNDYGQLGDLNQAGGDIAPSTVVMVDIGEGRHAQAIAAGGFSSCAVRDGGDVTCWGQNNAGQIGIELGMGRDPAAPGAPVDLGTGRSARAVTVGTSHACALLDDFSVKCWGLNLEGELGIGDANNRAAPLLGDALPPVPLGAAAVSGISAGARHTCAVQGPTVKCWGANGSGQLGVGDAKNRGDSPADTIAPVTF
jgi:alpha-tubulin suppressor-like RCC1 family protein